MEHKQILIIQTAFIGDVILCTPLIKGLRKTFPDAFISFLLIPETENVLKNNPHLNEMLVYDKRKKRGLGSFLQIVTRVKQGKFDLAVIPHRSLRSSLLAYLSDIPERIGFDRAVGSSLFTRKVVYKANVHEVGRNLSLLSDFTPHLTDTSPELFPSPEDFSHARKLLSDAGIAEGDEIVGVAPGSIWATKRWLPERFAEVADLLLKQAGTKIVLLGSEDDRPLCEKIAESMTETPAIVAGKTSVLQSAAIMSLCRVILSNDSAPVHIASAMRIPVVAIFGSTIPEFGFAPYGVDHVIIQRELDCRPCGIHGKRECPERHFRCMQDISAKEVSEVLLSLLKKGV
ncbi:MAG: lipopolysaccharide heptosyltransferase II [Candidatus Zixiibacteriota bacterium]|nr:MAG: lipopolysaccharide heptosyltransferase II [candidate division Zixibacteria bacterium]